MENMDDRALLRHVFEAFSSLSDAEDSLTEFHAPDRGRIEHAKEHLNAIMLAAGSEATVAAIEASMAGCSLEKEGSSGTDRM